MGNTLNFVEFIKCIHVYALLNVSINISYFSHGYLTHINYPLFPILPPVPYRASGRHGTDAIQPAQHPARTHVRFFPVPVGASRETAQPWQV